MGLSAVLVANRGEVALRVIRAAAEQGVRTIAVHSQDDADAPHVRRADEAYALSGSGPAAYLDGEQLAGIAERAGADAVHPGYGFLSESAEFAERCARAGLVFVGPTPDVLRLLGDKTRARRLARELDVPTLAGTDGPTTLESARAFLRDSGNPVVVKALAGGGGRGVRRAGDVAELDAAFERCASEARQAFGNGDLYVERYLPRARHIEIQVVADRGGAVAHLGERDCSVQRNHQKLIEITPSPSLPDHMRERIAQAAVRMAAHAGYDGLGTFEFLVSGEEFAFLEANPRLQVEHAVTEEVTGVDLVQTQLRIAVGDSLADLGLRQQDVPRPRGFCLQARVNLESFGADGEVRGSSGTLATFEPPTGPGVRVDTHGHAGSRANPRFDPLLAKVVVPLAREDFPALCSRAWRLLGEFEISGAQTNLALLRAVLAHPEFVAGNVDVDFIAQRWDELAAGIPVADPPVVEAQCTDESGNTVVSAPMSATVLQVVASGEVVRRGQTVAVLEAMKMEHLVTAPSDGVVERAAVAAGVLVEPGAPLLVLNADENGGESVDQQREPDLDEIPASLGEVRERQDAVLDEHRPEAVRRRHERGHRTVRENLAELCDPGTFVEYGALALAAQRRRRGLAELVERTPADGQVCGIGDVHGQRCVVLAYDYTVLAGTQGILNHAKTDRMVRLAERHRLPVVLLAEGGGGRPGDTDTASVSGLEVETFHAFGRLSGLVPLVGVVSGWCFAGNAALLGCCDVVIATRDSSIGMAGPAMIEGGGLGSHRPEDVGPADVQSGNGVIDVLVEDETEAVRTARHYLTHFQPDAADAGQTDNPDGSDRSDCADQRLLRHAVPENRRRVYDVRRVVHTLADTGSVLELRREFGIGMITALVRVNGRSLGLVANNPAHLGGALDSDASDKMARFLQLCEAHGLPIVSLCDTPGFMVGPDSERTATVRHFGRLFVTGANLTVPLCTIVLRKGYGLGAQAMAGGSFRAPAGIVSWPTGEIGGMGLEGAVHLGYRRELAAVEDPRQRQREFDRLVDEAYERGKALNAATVFELDDVIDPADTRAWIVRTLSLPRAEPPEKPARFVDTW